VSGISTVLTLYFVSRSLRNFKAKKICFVHHCHLNITPLGSYKFVVTEGMFMFSVYR